MTPVAMALLVIGLLLTTLSLSLAKSLHWSDATRGIVAGTGLGLELIAFILLLRQMRSRRSA